ncbi:MAG TPA: response regulator [Actinomycetota bacterium]|nr:response regulator [Actinomycetota bacterium]
MSRGRVLIAEDEATLAWVEQFNLESEGYEVRIAPEGRSALEEVEAFTPDVLILDVMLPYLDGWSILANIRDLPDHRRPKVILVSAAAGVVDRAQEEGLSIESVLSKPFDMDELLGRVAALTATA